MIDFELSINNEDIAREIERSISDELDRLRDVLERVGRETVAYLRSYTSETRPPKRPGQPNRLAHPGGWADVTQDLANAYDHKVDVGEDSVTLTLLNTMEYAAMLEARDGYFVLRGVTEPGGPIEQALRAVVPRVAPGWTVMV